MSAAAEALCAMVQQALYTQRRWDATLAGRIREAIEAIEADAWRRAHGIRRAEGRILRWIADHERQTVTHEQLAADLGLSRETVTRHICDLRRAGRIVGARGTGYVVLEDADE